MNRIAIMRKKAGLRQSDLALAVGVTQGAVAHWENQENNPTLNRLKRIAEVLRCNVDDLLEGGAVR